MTPQQTRKNVQNSAAPAQTPRLRLKPKAPQSGYVDGAWWPHTDDLAAELPDLLAVLSVRLGRIDRVLYNLNEWASAPRKLVVGAQVVCLGEYRLQPTGTIEVVGLDRDRIVLLVVPALTDPDDAHTIMMTAAEPNNAATTDDLFLISPRGRDGHPLVVNAQERWESEGGTTVSAALAEARG